MDSFEQYYVTKSVISITFKSGSYEAKYREHLTISKNLLKECHEKRTSTMWSLYSYRSMAEYVLWS